jgi:hypothetical protein
MHQSPGSFSVSSRLGQAGCVIQFWEVCAEEEAAAAMGMGMGIVCAPFGLYLYVGELRIWVLDNRRSVGLLATRRTSPSVTEAEIGV